MIGENIKNYRKARGLSQEELSVKVNVVRQTVSKWETGLSVPDAEMLISLSSALETPVSTLLGKASAPEKADDIKALAEKLEVINLQLAKRNSTIRKSFHWVFISLIILILLVAAFLFFLGSPYLNWNYDHSEWAVLGVVFHSFEWAFFRIAPFALIAVIVGAVLTRKKENL